MRFPPGNQSGGRSRFRLHMLRRQAQEFDNRITHAASDSNFDHAFFPARLHDTPRQTNRDRGQPLQAAPAYFAERDRCFRGIVTDGEMLHGYGLMLPQTVTLFVKSRSRFGETTVTMA